MILINDSPIDARDGERLIDVICRSGVELPHVCYHPQLGAIQTCDTCMVEIDGELVGNCPVEFKIRAGALRVLTPR